MRPISSASSVAAGATAQNPSKRGRSLHCAPLASPTDPARASTMTPSSLDLLAVTAQLIEAARRARDGDSDGTRAHIARAVTLLDGHPGPRVARHTGDRAARQIRRGGLAAWQSRRLAA